MNKITLKNFFATSLACLLIIAMMLLQLQNLSPEYKFAYIIELIVVIAAVIFILYRILTISKELSNKNTTLDNITKELEDLKKQNTTLNQENNTKQ